LLETLWKDFEYLIWVDYRDSIIKKANLTATNKNNEITRLEIAVEFSDFGSNLEIKAPALSSNKLKISGGRQTNLRRFFFRIWWTSLIK